MKALICGGRDYTNRVFLRAWLDQQHKLRPITLVIQGGAKGADALAKEWARDRGIPCDEYKADWSRFGRGAGPERNGRMLREGKPDAVIAFPGHAGTSHMVQLAIRAGVTVIQP